MSWTDIAWVVYFVLAHIWWSYVAIQIYKWNNKRRDMKFLRAVKIEHPESKVTFIAVETSDDEALKKIKEQFCAVR